MQTLHFSGLTEETNLICLLSENSLFMWTTDLHTINVFDERKCVPLSQLVQFLCLLPLFDAWLKLLQLYVWYSFALYVSDIHRYIIIHVDTTLHTAEHPYGMDLNSYRPVSLEPTDTLYFWKYSFKTKFANLFKESVI